MYLFFISILFLAKKPVRSRQKYSTTTNGRQAKASPQNRADIPKGSNTTSFDKCSQ